MPKMKWLLNILNILGPEIRKPLLEEIIKLQYTSAVFVTTYTEHTKSRNMEATSRGNQLYWLLHIQNIIGTEMQKPLLEEIIGYRSCNGYYIY